MNTVQEVPESRGSKIVGYCLYAFVALLAYTVYVAWDVKSTYDKDHSMAAMKCLEHVASVPNPVYMTVCRQLDFTSDEGFDAFMTSANKD
ncbi:hypothetical protein ACLHZ0_21820 [Aeromonas salmonicida]|uniref:hypothetical protein n=1 Tax=Aeromonas salmonicida TaxID=645 RepID=UPI003D084DA3